MTPQQLNSILDEFAKVKRENAYLVVSRTKPPLPLEQVFPHGSSVEWLCHVYSPEDLVAVERADLCIIFDQLEHMQKSGGTQLLGRLRDQYSRRVLLHCTGQAFSDMELLALGYVKQKHPSIDGCFFLFDPDLFFEPRDWNTPEKWANPENFKKYRW
jgi:hypothetical protein